jgi:capsular polysaccharide biosynthesis protein
MEETISLKEIFATIKKRMWMIVLITAIATGLSGIISYFFMTPIYQSSTQILIQSESKEQTFDVNQVRTNLELINTYSVIIKSPTILEKVVDRLDLDQTADGVRQNLTVSSEQNSQVVNIAVDNSDPAKAVQIANGIAQVFQTEIVDIMSVDNVSILSQAELSDNPSPVKPNPLLNMAIAFVVGLMTGVGVAFLLEYLDNTIKTEHDIEQLLELPVLGAITEIDINEQENYRTELASQRLGGQSVGS